MKITKSKLKQIIEEELGALSESLEDRLYGHPDEDATDWREVPASTGGDPAADLQTIRHKLGDPSAHLVPSWGDGVVVAWRVVSPKQWFPWARDEAAAVAEALASIPEHSP